jgi:beta-lactamase superfamily II metal-dependent hydrolase
MSFLAYYRDDGEDHTPSPAPARVYARVDRHEPTDANEGPRTLLLDSIDADWFDELSNEISWLGEVFEDADYRVSVVELKLGEPGSGVPDLRVEEGDWLELFFSDVGFEVLHYLNLFADPIVRMVNHCDRPSSGTTARLDQVTDLGSLPDADEAEIRSVLRRATTATSGAAVYDVGQGNCTALLSPRGFPALYFDFGGAVMGNKRTFPVALQRFCVSVAPPVVLSHWDHDHWSSAERDTRAQELTWVVPRHDNRLPPTHTVFLGKLQSRGRVLIWPSGLDSITEGTVTLERCRGPEWSHNDSGLAMVVETPAGRRLFPGDCRYDHVPSAQGMLTSVVVPHHGGRTESSFVPSSDGQPSGRLVYSYGVSNIWWHPFTDVEYGHDDAGWRRKVVRHTGLRNDRGLGHVHLYWSDADADATPPCRGLNCNLTCHQR